MGFLTNLNRRTRLLVAAGAAATVLVGCSSGTPAAPAPAPGSAPGSAPAAPATDLNYSLEFKLDGIHAPYLTAQKNGWYEEAGVKVKFAPSGGSQDSLGRVATGAAGMGSVTSLVALQGLEKDMPITIVGVMLQHDATATEVLASSGIEHPRDLAGKSIGFAQAGGLQALLPAFAEKVGLDASSVKIVGVEPASVKPSLLAGQIDAANFFGPVFAGMDEVRVMPWHSYGFSILGTVIIANNDYLANNPDAVRAFLAQSVRGMDEVVKDPAGAGDIVAAATSTDPAFYRVQVPDFMQYFDVDAAPAGTFSSSAEQWADTIKVYREGGLLKADLEAADVFTNDYLPKQ